MPFSLSILMPFPAELELAVVYKAKDDGSGGDNWSYKSFKAPVKSSLPTNTQFFYRPDALPVTQPTLSQHSANKLVICVSSLYRFVACVV